MCSWQSAAGGCEVATRHLAARPAALPKKLSSAVCSGGLLLQYATGDWTAAPLVADEDASYTGYLS